MRSFSIALGAALLLIGVHAWANIPLLGVGSGGSGAPPGACTGTIDLSEGCVLTVIP